MSSSSNRRKKNLELRERNSSIRENNKIPYMLKTAKTVASNDYKESNRKLFNSNATYYRVIGHMDAIQNMTDKELNKTSYLEIFKSTKGSIKKSINYINYTKHDHNVITNQRLSSAYTSFRDNLMKYENCENDFNPDSKTKFLNRSPPHRDK